MSTRRWIYGACIAAVLLLGMSAVPRYIEELRVGGGYGDADGGLDIEANGALSTDGAVLVEGDLTTRGRITAGVTGHVLTTSEGYLDGAKLVDDSVSDAKVSDDLTIDSTGSVDGGAVDIPAALNETAVENADTLLIHDASAESTREMSRQDFLAGVEGLWSDAEGYIYPQNAAGVHIEDDGDLVTDGGLEIQGGPVSVGTASGTTYLMKSQMEGSETLTLTSRSAFEGHVIWSGDSHSMSNIQGVVGRASVGTGYSATSTEVVGVRGLAIVGPVFSEITRAIGAKGQIVLNQSGVMTDGFALYGGTVGASGTVSNLYGLYVEDITKGSLCNYAIYTGLGRCHFGDDVSVCGALSTSSVVTFSANDTTPTVAGANLFRVPDTWTSGNDVTNLDDGVDGQRVTVVGGDADCVFADNTNLYLSGAWTAHPGDTLVLVYVDGTWYELSRSDNQESV
ncbi:MAG: hypothetical protein R6V12_09560 [Candidatus Hydrogenedentota bacterium]